jgi:hypothetical protein
MAPREFVGVPDNDRYLDEFHSEGQSAGTEAPAMAESLAGTIGGYALAVCAFVALRCDSFVWHASRVADDASRISRAHAARVRRRSAKAVQSLSATSDLETEGALVATALAVAALGYGGLLVTSWNEPAHTPSALASPLAAGLVPISAGTTSVELAPVAAAVTPAPLAPPTEVRFRSRPVTVSRLNTILRRNDSRSLQHAFDSLRRETLTFHRCGMRLIAADRAVANCDGVVGPDGDHRVRWTIDFQRTGSRWTIQHVSAR